MKTRATVSLSTRPRRRAGVGLCVLFFVGPRWLTRPPPAEPEHRAAGPRRSAEDQGASVLRRRRRHPPVGGRAGSRLRRRHRRAGQAHRRGAARAAPQRRSSSAIPPGTKLKTIFLTKQRRGLRRSEPRGARESSRRDDERDSDRLCARERADRRICRPITGVQILIDGKEVDTLAGHLDLRRPAGSRITSGLPN